MVRGGVRRISGEALAAPRPRQPTALLMAALRTSEPYFSLRRIRLRKTRGHGPAAAVGAFHQQSVRLDHRSGSRILRAMNRQRSGIADGSRSMRTPCSALPFLRCRVFVLALRDAVASHQGGCHERAGPAPNSAGIPRAFTATWSPIPLRCAPLARSPSRAADGSSEPVVALER
jgi:hypothetical protein